MRDYPLAGIANRRSELVYYTSKIARTVVRVRCFHFL